MKKIAVIGCGGAGKTNLSMALANLLSLPVHHLDQLYWSSGWRPIDREDFIRAQEDIFSTNNWIIDGNYGGTMEARLNEANTIIFLDMPTITCLWGVINRYFQYKNSTRPDMTEGNNERVTLEFLSYIFSYRSKKRPTILQKLKSLTGKEIVVLVSRKDIQEYLNNSAKTRTQMGAVALV